MSNIFDILYPKPSTVVGGTYKLSTPPPAPAEIPSPAPTKVGGAYAVATQAPAPGKQVLTPPLETVGGGFATAAAIPGPGAAVVPQRAQASAYEATAIFDQNLVDSGIENWPPRNTTPGSGTTASIDAPGGRLPVHRPWQFYIALDGVTNFNDGDVGRLVTVSGAADPGFNITYSVFSVNDPTSAILFGDPGDPRVTPPSPPDANNGAIHWVLI
jgi:hypothetical protein